MKPKLKTHSLDQVIKASSKKPGFKRAYNEELAKLKSKNKIVSRTKPLKLNLGCGGRAFSGFTNVDKYYTVKELKELNAHVENAEFMQADILKLPFPDNSADVIENMDMIEHLKMQAVVPALKEWHRVLKPGGELMVITIDFTGLAKHWISDVGNREFNLQTYIDWSEVIYGIQTDDGQYHKTPFTKEFMEFCLKLAGFSKSEVRIVQRGEQIPPEYRSAPEVAWMYVRSDMLIVHAWK